MSGSDLCLISACGSGVAIWPSTAMPPALDASAIIWDVGRGILAFASCSFAPASALALLRGVWGVGGVSGCNCLLGKFLLPCFLDAVVGTDMLLNEIVMQCTQCYWGSAI